MMKPLVAMVALVGITLLALEPTDAALCMCHPSSCLLVNPDNAALSHVELHCATDKLAINDLMILRFTEASISADALASFPNLTALELFQGSLSHIEPGVFEKVPGLLKIIIRNNQLPTLDDYSFRGLAGLEVLYIISSGLSNIAPKAFDGLNNLTHLTLAGNTLTQVPEKLFASSPALQSISLPGNKITDLPAGLFDNINYLIRLDLSFNRLTTFDFPNLKAAAVMLHNNSLTSLSLNDHYSVVQANQNHITKLGGTGANLTTLLLSENNITDITPITRMTNITKLVLSTNPLQPNSVFSSLTRLEELLLSHTNIQIGEQTFASLSELKLLDLSYNNLTELDFRMFSSLFELHTLIVAYNRIGKINFFEQREYLPRLRVLEICGNGWNATHLANVLDQMRKYHLRADVQGFAHTVLFSSTFVDLCSTESEAANKSITDDDYYSEDISDILEQEMADVFSSSSYPSTTSTRATTIATPTTAKMATADKRPLTTPSAQPTVRLITTDPQTMPPVEPQPVVGSSPLYVTFQVLVYTFSVFGIVCLVGLVYYMRQRRFDVRRVTVIDSADSVRLV